MPINIIYAYPLYLGGYDVAAMLGGNADQQIVLCNDLSRSTAYLVTGSRIDREVAEMLLERRATEYSDRPVVWVVSDELVLFYHTITDFKAGQDVPRVVAFPDWPTRDADSNEIVAVLEARGYQVIDDPAEFTDSPMRNVLDALQQVTLTVKHPTDEQAIEYARRALAKEGEIEIDDDAKVSRSPDNEDRGAAKRVAAWRWVPDEDCRAFFDAADDESDAAEADEE